MSVQPNNDTITAQISADGKLLYADPALRRLHIKAGGIDGGAVAIPSLANIAKLTHKLKIPLSRMVQIADEDFDIELWIDSKLSGDIVTLSILGWNEKHIIQAYEPVGVSIRTDQFDEDILFLTDQNMNIISFQSGEKNVAAFGQFIGRGLFSILSTEPSAAERLKDELAELETIEDVIVKIADWREAYEFSAIPRYDDNDQYLGYECYIQLINNEFRSGSTNPNIHNSNISNSDIIYQGLMASQLAPAIRQPLGRIIANADTIGSKLHGPIRENYANYAKDIASAARHLIEIVDDLGDLEAIEKPSFEIAKDDLELGDIASRLAGLLALKASEKSIEIEVAASDKPVQAVGEFRRVLQIGLNLLTNAVRYSPANTNILIEYGWLGDGVYLSVKDQGAGIDERLHHKIFEKFERLGQTSDGGSGLGLYISRRLALAMGGDLILESSSDSGSCFTLLLPKAVVSDQ